jgi:hypothetical protein
MHLRPRSIALAIALVGSSLMLASTPAHASPETLKRSMAGIFYAPFDMILSPITAGFTLVKNLRDIEDTTGVRVVYAVPGYFWLAGLDFMAGGMRGIAGFIEFLPGIAVYPFEADFYTLYDPAERGPALVEFENPLADMGSVSFVPLLSSSPRFGIDYTTTE